MGFFSNLASMIGDSVAKTKDVSDEAYLDGLNLDINIICRKIKSESSVVKKNGYGNDKRRWCTEESEMVENLNKIYFKFSI